MLRILLALLLAQAPASTSTATTPTAGTNSSASEPAQSRIDPEIAEKLLKVRRIYVDSFGEDTISDQLKAMVINALTESKRFIITENKDRADAVLRGTGLEKTAQELHAISEGTAVSSAHGGESGSVNGTVSNGTGTISGSHHGGFFASGASTADSQASTETVNDARLAVRLVSTDGDVIWATTKESKGAKYKGASADVADQVVKQLLSDLEKLSAGQK